MLTGLLYVDTKAPSLLELLGLPEAPLATLPESATRPSRAMLEEIVEGLR